ncbi:MAG: hypothetical protein ACK4H7_04585 [Acidilobaceae archaeon]
MDIAEKALTLRVSSLNDLVRLAVSMAIPSQLTPYLLKFRYNGKIILGLLGVFRDYYKYYGVPVFYYFSVNEDDRQVLEANYIIASTGEERIELSKNPRPGVLIPLIELAEKPPFLPNEF